MIAERDLRDERDGRGLVWFIWSVWFNQTDEIDQVNKRDQPVPRRTVCSTFDGGLDLSRCPRYSLTYELEGPHYHRSGEAWR